MSASQEVGEIFGHGSGPTTALLRSPTVIIASIGLWGMNIYLFRAFGIDYKRTFLNGDAGRKKSGDEDDELNSDRNVVESGGIEPPPKSGQLKATTVTTAESSAIHRDRIAVAQLEGTDMEVLALTSPAGSTNATSTPASPDFTAPRLLVLSLCLLFLLHITSFTWIHLLGGNGIGAIFAFYFFVTVGALLPNPSSAWARRGLKIVGSRLLELVNPRCYCCSYEVYKPVPFVDVFFADALCSLSKVFFDWGMLWHMASHYPDPVPASAHSIMIPSACAALPYIIRARQCMVMHTVGVLKNDPKRYQHILNAIKYSSSLFPICVSAYQKTLTPDEPTKAAALEAFLILLLILNSFYCFAWDVVMDWGMVSDPTALLDPMKHMQEPQMCQQKCLRPRLRFGFKISTGILITNFVLRFAWLLRFWEKQIFFSFDEFVLCTEFLEVFRRALWNLLRVEWEQIKITTQDVKAHIEDDVYDYDTNINVGFSMVPLVPSRRN